MAVAANVYGDTRSCCLRYGNVVGSRGSVLDIWRRQAEAGQPLTITDPDMTRFWLPIDDAVGLALLAIERTGGGEVFIPKDVARSRVGRFARSHFQSSEIVVTGKRSYEKMHECLIAPEEVDRCVDAGDCYVLQPLHVRWEPGPWGAEFPLVGKDFQYRSDI